MSICQRCKTPGQRVLVKGLCLACAGSELVELRKRDAERKAVIDDALCGEIEKLKDLQRAKERTVEGLKKELEEMANCHCMQCTDMQCEGPSRAKAKED